MDLPVSGPDPRCTADAVRVIGETSPPGAGNRPRPVVFPGGTGRLRLASVRDAHRARARTRSARGPGRRGTHRARRRGAGVRRIRRRQDVVRRSVRRGSARRHPGALGRVRPAVHAPPPGPAARCRFGFHRRDAQAPRQRRPALRHLRRGVRGPACASVGAGARRPAMGRPGHDRSAAVPAPPRGAVASAHGRHPARRRGQRHPPAARPARRRRAFAARPVADTARTESGGHRGDGRRP